MVQEIFDGMLPGANAEAVKLGSDTEDSSARF